MTLVATRLEVISSQQIDDLHQASLKILNETGIVFQAIDTVNVVGGLPIEATDVDPKRKYLKMLHQVIRHSDKPIWAFSGSQKEVISLFDMMEIAFGKKKEQCLQSTPGR
jgi:trimethylamine:corrinoid methyltransferase-like protein